MHVHNVDGTPQQPQGPTNISGLLAPATVEDSNTQVSSSSGSGKPPSLDGSGPTFALDEKESLRPDDSASVKAADDEDVFRPLSSGLPGSHVGSEEGVRAFRDQLQEISSMEPSRRNGTPQGFRSSVHPQQGVLYIPPQGLGVGLVPNTARLSSATNDGVDFPPDSKLLEALESPRDRIWVLKLEQDIFDFVKDAKEASLNLPQCNAYHRMLAHKIADYYMLGHLVDDSASAVRLYKTPNCRIPPPLTGITTPSTAASTPPPAAPQMKILRRGGDSGPAIANGSNIPSKSTSEGGESEDEKKKPTREEREARYEAARLRIMGAAKPSESPDEPRPKDDSRSSSVNGKKPKKKQRSDSDDGFEARSAYSAYYTPPYSSNGFTPTSYGFPTFSEPAHGHGATPSIFNAQDHTRGSQPYATPAHGTMPWSAQGYPVNSEAQRWAQGQQPAYDLSGNFQQAMSFQSPSMSTHASAMSSGFDAVYPQQYYGAQQAWSPQEYQMPSQPGHGNNAHIQGYQQRPSSSSSQAQDLRPYQFGQLPSQAFPGRQPSKLEHPLPGSYKGKHFNPQSQAFVPGQQNSSPVRPFTPQTAGANTTGFAGVLAMASVPQRQPSAQSQSSAFGSPYHPSASAPVAHPQSQSMVHPLPQPVFPQQPSPNLPLPPKPGLTPQKPTQLQGTPSPTVNAGNGQNPSSIAKWGTPASLPAKPPPPAEPFDPARFAQVQRQPSYTAAATARVPSGGMPSFGSVPPISGGLGVNGMGAHRQ